MLIVCVIKNHYVEISLPKENATVKKQTEDNF